MRHALVTLVDSDSFQITDSNGVEIGPKGVFNINFDGNDRPVGEPSPIIVVASFPQLALAPGQYRWVVAWGDNAANRTAMTMEVIDPATFAS